MSKRIMDTTPSKKLENELIELITKSKTFSNNLREVIKEFEIDVPGERRATVEVLNVVLQKWVVEIIHVLFIEGSMRFNDIKRNLHGISSRTLSNKLRLLEDEGFVERRTVSERPMVTEYALTDKGQIFAELSTPIIFYLKMEGRKI
jgi:DNA-binding HxlR family transcriptional regulator